MKSILGGLAVAASLTVAAPALAQPGGNACPAGTAPSIVRVSTIKPAGSMAGFQEAARDHLKWYRDHGYTANTITVSPVVETQDQGKTWTISSTQVLSIHYNDPGVPREALDDAWRAYVAKYRANSDITTEIATCLPVK